ncbi:MAG: hypothetical protein OEY32_13000 [Candidatus Krumholzibacteria bacterium]|nr:hypothetical protein [Candidatus Krumholzibacteria bacterium]
MKRIFLVLMMAMMVGACVESSTDVETRRGGSSGGDGGFVPPDTVIKIEHATLNAYKPGNPGAVAPVRDLTATASFNDAVAVAATFGYSFDPTALTVASGRTDDGRAVLVALGALRGGDGGGLAVYLRVDDRERSFPLRLTDRDQSGFEVLQDAGKQETGPQNRPWYYGDLLNCLQYVVADLTACRQSCQWCGPICDLRALVNLVVCVLVYML